MECLGCRLANKEEMVHVVYENEFISCFLDHDPFNEGHVLILPKQHVYELDELDDETAHSIMDASILLSKAIKKQFNPDGITINQNGGIFNELTHYHMHVVPRYQTQSFALFYTGEDNYIEEESTLNETSRILEDAIKELLAVE